MASEIEINCVVPPAGKAKKNSDVTKVYKSKFKKEWMKEFPFSQANGNEYAFYCIPFKKNVSCSHQGFSDVQRHMKSTTHVNMSKAITDNRKVSDIFAPSKREAELREAIVRAEVLHTNFIAQHNLSFLSSDHVTKLYEKMFPDSKIAKRFACSRKGTACILNGAMMPSLKVSLTTYMKIDKFVIVNDGSCDTGLEKMNAVCIHIFDDERSNEVEVKFFNMRTTSSEHCFTTESLFNTIDNAFTSDEIS